MANPPPDRYTLRSLTGLSEQDGIATKRHLRKIPSSGDSIFGRQYIRETTDLRETIARTKTMARVCEVCGKKSQMGNSVETRGKAKYLGGVGTKITGITRRQFKPNLQRVRVTTSGGSNKTMRVCTQCLRSGAVQKVVRNKPFRVPTSPSKS